MEMGQDQKHKTSDLLEVKLKSKPFEKIKLNIGKKGLESRVLQLFK
jgi:hypothetical protein